MKIKDIAACIEEIAPLNYAEDFDNVGLLVGNQESEATGVLVCHDALENVIEEAIAKNCNFITCKRFKLPHIAPNIEFLGVFIIAKKHRKGKAMLERGN